MTTLILSWNVLNNLKNNTSVNDFKSKTVFKIEYCKLELFCQAYLKKFIKIIKSISQVQKKAVTLTTKLLFTEQNKLSKPIEF